MTAGHRVIAPETAQVVDLVAAARMLGIGRTLAYRHVQEGRWPTPIIRSGRLIKVPLEPLGEYIREPQSHI
jgi:predicted site-specific integrase-resolvase